MHGDPTPIFWRPQPRWDPSVQRVLRLRLERALENPSARAELVWPTILGAPRQRERHPHGIPVGDLLAAARPMLKPLGHEDPSAAWDEALATPELAEAGETGWKPHSLWIHQADQVSLRSGVALLALMGLPLDERYRLAAAVTLFNSALFHEAHDALEGLWLASRGQLKAGLQGLILLSGGFHHLQQRRAPGMLALWQHAAALLGERDGNLETPWGVVDFSLGLQAAVERLAWLDDKDDEDDLSPLWQLRRPVWEWNA